ncbi:MAG: glycerate kinase [Deltaproteobacteria bacterium]|jgi:glycerate kinase|nr:glycerate kinase [Deltaproteobacteria bacterium]
MKIVIAPDSFKDSLTNLQAAMAIKRGLVNVWPYCEYQIFPVSDGGAGTVGALVYLSGGQEIRGEVADPLGRRRTAAWGLMGDKATAVVEISAACGLAKLLPQELNPSRASTRGFGEQINDALNRGIKRLILGLGGSATNDAGAGMLEALGMRLLKKGGDPVEPGALGLKELATIDPSGLNPRLAEVEIIVACAVKNPLLGPKGTTQIFGPKKGVTNLLMPQLDEALAHFHDVASQATGKNVACAEGAGAAGGVGAALMMYTNSVFEKGVEVVLSHGNFEERAKGASLIITGEGQTDLETVWWGKAPLGVAKAGEKLGIPTVVIAGSLESGYQKLYENGMAGVMSMLPYPMNYPQALRDAAPILEDAAWRLGRLLSIKAKGLEKEAREPQGVLASGPVIL